jgi:hypothetical protein
MALVVSAYIINFLGSSLLEIASLAAYAFLSIVNVVGSFIKGFVDAAAYRLLGAIGQCQEPGAACAYVPLDFTFGVHYPQAAPLIDPRKYFPTHFNNNSILSVLLDFLALVPPIVLIGLGALAIFLGPIVLMEHDEPWKRILTAVLIGLCIAPAFLTQSFLQESFYHTAADMFRTGVGRIILEPAEALARGTRDAVQDATFNPFGGS